MTDIGVLSNDQLATEALNLEGTDGYPRFDLDVDFDPERRLTVTVPLNPFDATWVTYEQMPVYLNQRHTKFVVKPPFDPKRPPRFTLYDPHDSKAFAPTHNWSIVREKDAVGSDAASVWEAWTVSSPQSLIAKGVMIDRTHRTITLQQPISREEVCLAWPNENIKLVREAPIRLGLTEDSVLLGHCPEGLDGPVGVRYGIPECLTARMTYMFELIYDNDAGEPNYKCGFRRQLLVTNNSDIAFPRIEAITVLNETFHASEDGHQTREFIAGAGLFPVSSTHPAMYMTIEPRSSCILNDPLREMVSSCKLSATVDVQFTNPGELSSVAIDAWSVSRELKKVVARPSAIQVHVHHNDTPYGNLTGVSFWEGKGSGLWTRVPVCRSTDNVIVQCFREERVGRARARHFEVFNDLSKPFVLVFTLSSQITNVETIDPEVRALEDVAWLQLNLGSQYKAFLLPGAPTVRRFVAYGPPTQ